MAMMASRPCSSLGGITGSTSVFSWKTKQERRATTSSGSYAPNVFSRISSVRISSLAELICIENECEDETRLIKIENQLSYFACDATFEQDRRVFVNELEFL